MTAVALTIAGSDPSGGAGLQADLKTFHQRGVYGTCIVTLLTIQSTLALRAVETLSADFVAQQYDELIKDIPPHAAKTGALGSPDIIELVADRVAVADWPVVVDPVLVSTHGTDLMERASQDGLTLLKSKLLPHAALVTPNRSEAEILSGKPVTDLASMRDAAWAIADMGPGAVIVKGGDMAGPPNDVLVLNGEIHVLEGNRVEGGPFHGTGCTHSAVITAELAKGASVQEAIQTAKRFITEGLIQSHAFGHGLGLVNHHVEV